MTNPPPDACLDHPTDQLDLRTKLAYGVGELGGEIPGSILVFFVLFFFTNVAGLSASLASSVLLVGKLWDALNDPVIGWLSDRTHSPLGRRYPWMLFGAVPLGLFFLLLWAVPPISSQWAFFAYYSLIVLLFYTAFTAVVVPFKTLAAELTESYDERTSLISFKAAFSVGGSILALVLARLIFAQVPDQNQQYLVMGAVCGGLASVAVYLCVWGTYKRYQLMREQHARVERPPIPPLLQQIRLVFHNRPFLSVTGMYLCSWLSLQIMASIFPYFVVHWMDLPMSHFTQMALVVQSTALAMMFIWGTVRERLDKKAIYFLGTPLTIGAQVGFFFLRPEQVGVMYALGVIAGIGISTAYLVPWSMLPDVIDLDELNTGQRREGVFYSFIVQLQKFGATIAIVLVGKILDQSGFTPAASDQLPMLQPDSALGAIRWLIGPLPGLILLGGMVAAYFYPISREVHQQIHLKLRERQAKV